MEGGVPELEAPTGITKVDAVCDLDERSAAVGTPGWSGCRGMKESGGL